MARSRLEHMHRGIAMAHARAYTYSHMQARLELGVHYRNPYPRRYHAPPNTSGRAVSEGRIARSAYQDSLYDA